MRGQVIAPFPSAPGLPTDRQAYLHSVEEISKGDAYHSLSSEGYNVTLELIERVQRGDWNSEHHYSDGQGRDTLAARGYWQAFGKVKQAVEQVQRQ